MIKNIFIFVVITSLMASCTLTDGYLGEPSAFVSNSVTISGVIIDSQTGRGLANALVSLTNDPNATTGVNAQYSTTTDQSGNYNLTNLPQGNYTVIVEASGYFPNRTQNVDVSNSQIQLTQLTLVQQPPVNSIRIVLTWGNTPGDLDTHFTGPSSDNSKFHIFFSNKAPSLAGSMLDVDDTSSYGPETVTISSLYNGTYRYSVHNYSDKTATGGAAIATSPAKVEIYNHDGIMGSYVAPAFTGNGNTWRVFELNVVGGVPTINVINTYTMADSYSDAAFFVKKQNTESN